jgi:hypothetical protein
MDCYSENYGQARAKFIQAARAEGAKLERIIQDAYGPNGDDLSVDVAWFGDPAASRVLAAFSGVHGVEGFFGSAVQIEWMRRGEYRRLLKHGSALLVHAVNPYGFAWLRRANETNVDVNRNWIDFDRPPPTNTAYDEIAADLCPSNWSAETQALTKSRLSVWREKNGWPAYIRAVSGGQWLHADGLFYGGKKESWSRKSLSDILRSYLDRASRLLVVDFHTGLGPHGYVEPIVHYGLDDPSFDRTRAWIGAAATSIHGGGSISAEVHGDVLNALPALLPNAIVDAVTLECGVQPIDKVETALRADNWLHAHGDPTGPDAPPIKRLIREAFHSDSPIWQGMALGQGLAACRAAVGGLLGR